MKNKQCTGSFIQVLIINLCGASDIFDMEISRVSLVFIRRSYEKEKDS